EFNLSIIAESDSNSMVFDATVADDGTLTFTGVPDPIALASSAIFQGGDFILTVGPLDANGDGVVESAGVVMDYSVLDLVQANQNTLIQMPDARADQLPSFSLVSTNVDSFINGSGSPPLKNMLKPSDPVTLVFSHRISPASLLVRVLDENGNKPVAVTS